MGAPASIKRDRVCRCAEIRARNEQPEGWAVSYARDPYDTGEPPCFCPVGSPDPRTTEEFCPAHGDPARPAPDEPPRTEECPDCQGAGIVDIGTAGCGGCSDYPGIKHEPACGVEPCPRGCEVVPRAAIPYTASGTKRKD